MRKKNLIPPSDTHLLLVMIFLIGTAFTIAILDSAYRQTFADLIKFVVGALVARLIPHSPSNDNSP